jgi:hypothetical protein
MPPKLFRMTRMLKVLAVAIALSFLGGAVLTASAASPAADAGTAEPTFFPATKAAVMPRPKPRDAGQPPQPTYFPASKSFGGEALPGVNDKLGGLKPKNPPPQQQSPQQNAP